MFVDPVFSVPLISLHSNYVCGHTITNIQTKPDLVQAKWAYIDNNSDLRYLGTQGGVFCCTTTRQ